VGFEDASQRKFFCVSTSCFAASAAMTVAGCRSMSAMGGTPMPGGWTLSMVWMRMPEQGWAGAAGSFLEMWVVMMAAMMLPSLIPTLWRCQKAAQRAGVTRPDRLTAITAGGYFFVWTLLGVVAFPLGAGLATLEIEHAVLARAVPATMGAIVLLAGALQFTAWKARRLACCRRIGCRPTPATAITAWRHGLRLGLDCCYCCLAPTAVLLVVGVMDLRAMAVVTGAITAERLAPAGAIVARLVGAAMILAGIVLIAHAPAAA
jgi:predicted metal-binding membrane protein